jgi:hypothetical protein
MTHKPFTSLVLTAVLGVSAVFSAQAAENKVKFTDNIFFDATFGGERPPGQESTGMASFGVNLSVPLTREFRGLALALQLGGDVKLRENGPEYDFTFGAFARNIEFGKQQVAVALLTDFRHTAYKNDIMGLRPILATTINQRDTIAISGVIGIQEASERFNNIFVKESMIDRVEVFWSRDWRNKWTTELSAGYHLKPVDEAVFGVQAVYPLSERVDFAVGGDVNTYGDYSIGFSLIFNFGGHSRLSSIHKARGEGSDLWTPFPKRSFPRLVHQDEAALDRRKRGKGAVPGAPPPPPPGSGGGSGSGE